jgi:hypothetical protein
MTYATSSGKHVCICGTILWVTTGRDDLLPANGVAVHAWHIDDVCAVGRGDDPAHDVVDNQGVVLWHGLCRDKEVWA